MSFWNFLVYAPVVEVGDMKMNFSSCISMILTFGNSEFCADDDDRIVAMEHYLFASCSDCYLQLLNAFGGNGFFRQRLIQSWEPCAFLCVVREFFLCCVLSHGRLVHSREFLVHALEFRLDSIYGSLRPIREGL